MQAVSFEAFLAKGRCHGEFTVCIKVKDVKKLQRIGLNNRISSM